MTLPWLLCIVGACVVGSIPFGVIIASARGVNIREHGSRNIGASNVGRVLGKRFGVLCFILDFLKGLAPTLIAGAINHTLGRDAESLASMQMWLWMAVAGASVVGHMYSFFLGFGGGKGVATGFGAIAGMYPLLTWPALAAIVVWYLALRITRYISVASMLAAMSLPISYLICALPPHAQDQPLMQTIDSLRHASPPLIGTLMVASLIVWKHRSNIARLRRGEEPRIGTPIQSDRA